MTTGKTIALIIGTFLAKWCLCFLIRCLGHFPFKQQVSFNFMAAGTIKSDFGAQENKICHCFHPSISHEVMGLDAMILVFLLLSFKPAIFHKASLK